MKIRCTQFLKATLLLILVSSLYSCRKDKDNEPEPEKTTGIFVLNEGGFNANNSTLSYYDFLGANVTSDIYSAANSGAKLGDTGQDAIVYGNKMYISVNNSNKVDVLNIKTSKLIKSITMTIAGAAPAYPRFLESAKGKVFISAYDDKVYVLDTLSLIMQKSIPVGRDPEQMAIVGDKLYVANSGGYGNYENTVSIIDLNSLIELKKITVGINSNQVVADKYGDVYVVSRGDYGSTPANLYRINTSNDQVIAMNIPVTEMAINEDIAYIYKSNYNYGTNSYDKGYLTLNVNNETVGPSFITDATDASIVLPYGIAVDPLSGDIFIADAKDYVNPGDVYCFGKDGKKKYTFKVGINPSKFVFYKK